MLLVYRKKNRFSKALFLVFLVVALVLCVFIYNSKLFERDAPNIKIEEEVYWNLKEPLKIEVDDASGIRFARVVLSDGENSIVLINEKLENVKNKTFEILFPRTGFFSKKNEYYLTFEAIDSSYWNFFAGNSAKEEVKIIVDTKRPDVQIVSNSYKITKGGTAVVIFKADDTNMRDVYVELKSGKKFQVAPFTGDNHYISLIAWPINEKDFSAYVVAVDKAGNIAKDRIKYYLDSANYKTSAIKLTDNFLDDSAASLAGSLVDSEVLSLSNLDKFKYINNDLRHINTEVLGNATNRITYNGNFNLRVFT
ncbi:MAG: M23 family peptidase, partial [Campylobacteraceae bacterium]|nr:M23 family peptidase [Campylobacteraceae bacterium]